MKLKFFVKNGTHGNEAELRSCMWLDVEGICMDGETRRSE
jgi:hypothetical protein